MTKYEVGPKILKKEQVLISIFLIAILVLSSGSMVAFAKNNTHVVKPNGVDDTADIQAAFNACGSAPGCTVQLVAGNYYVGQVAVIGFQGRFVGMGQGVTSIQALPNLPPPNPTYNTDTEPFWAALPTPAGVLNANPWPDLFTFVNGAFVMSGMTISEPYTNLDATTCTAVTPCPTVGYDDAIEGGPSTDTALLAAIIITGETESVTIDHVTVTAPTTTNMNQGILDWGLLLPTGWVAGGSLVDEIPLTGTFSLTNSLLVDTNPSVGHLANAFVTISHNTVEGSPDLAYVFDVSNSKITITGNQGINLPGFIGVFVEQAGFWPVCTASVTSDCLLPYTLYVTNNNLQVNEGADGLYLADFGTPSTLSAVVSGNVVQTDASCGCYLSNNPGYSAIISQSLKSLVLSLNMITTTTTGGAPVAPGIYATGGPATIIGNAITGTSTGVWVDYANGVHVTANAIKNSVQYGIAVTDGSTNNRVIGNFITGTASGGYDLYWDNTGTGNVWSGNFCGDHTSSPPGLC